jgi:beta-glucanase (GH16 family)
MKSMLMTVLPWLAATFCLLTLAVVVVAVRRGARRHAMAAFALMALAGVSSLLWLTPKAGIAAEQTQIDLADYNLTFEENFDDISVSAWGPISMPGAPGKSRWIAHTPWNGDFGDAQFKDPTPDGPFSTENGILKIEARKINGKWFSGLISSMDANGNGFAQRHGYFEIRTKLPKGPGVWPAFWLIANQQPDASAEIDVLEYYGQFPETYHVVTHVWPKTDKVKPLHDSRAITVPSGSLTEDYHTFGVSVQSDFIIYYLDRKEVARAPTPPQHNEPLFILANLALGSGWPIDKTPDPSVMLIDYIRAYSKKTAN